MKLLIVNVTGTNAGVVLGGTNVWIVAPGSIEVETSHGSISGAWGSYSLTNVWGTQVVLTPAGAEFVESGSLMFWWMTGFLLVVGLAISAWGVKALRWGSGSRVSVPEI